MECVGLVARPVFKTGLRARCVRGGSIPPHSAVRAGRQKGARFGDERPYRSWSSPARDRRQIVNGTCFSKPRSIWPAR